MRVWQNCRGFKLFKLKHFVVSYKLNKFARYKKRICNE